MKLKKQLKRLASLTPILLTQKHFFSHNPNDILPTKLL